MTTYATPEERLAHMERLTGMTRAEIVDHTKRTIALHAEVAQARYDGATDAEMVAIAATLKGRERVIATR